MRTRRPTKSVLYASVVMSGWSGFFGSPASGRGWAQRPRGQARAGGAKRTLRHVDRQPLGVPLGRLELAALADLLGRLVLDGHRQRVLEPLHVLSGAAPERQGRQAPRPGQRSIGAPERFPRGAASCASRAAPCRPAAAAAGRRPSAPAAGSAPSRPPCLLSSLPQLSRDSAHAKPDTPSLRDRSRCSRMNTSECR